MRFSHCDRSQVAALVEEDVLTLLVESPGLVETNSNHLNN